MPTVNEELTSAISLSVVEALRPVIETEPDVVFSLSRNLGWRRDGDLEQASKSAWDIVFDIICVVRDNPQLEGNDRYTYIYNMAAERMWMWYTLAVSIYTGERPHADSPIWKPQFEMPKRNGAPNLTIFGQVCDAEGRTASLTITDQSTAENVLQQWEAVKTLYDAGTAISMLNNLNKFGDKPVRGLKVKQGYNNSKPPTRAAAAGSPPTTKVPARKFSK